MFERFTPGALAIVIVIDAQRHARTLGHRYIGCEHLLLAAVPGGEAASAVLRSTASRQSAWRRRSSARSGWAPAE